MPTLRNATCECGASLYTNTKRRAGHITDIELRSCPKCTFTEDELYVLRQACLEATARPGLATALKRIEHLLTLTLLK